MTAKRAVLELVGLVLLVDALFVAAYFLLDIRTARDSAKLTFTVVWTLVTLAVVIRGLSRLRRGRLDRARPTP
jgi:hypothetical protein